MFISAEPPPLCRLCGETATAQRIKDEYAAGTNLLEQYDYLGLGGVLWCQTTDDPDAVPTFGNLGVGSHLYWWVST